MTIPYKSYKHAATASWYCAENFRHTDSLVALKKIVLNKDLNPDKMKSQCDVKKNKNKEKKQE